MASTAEPRHRRRPGGDPLHLRQHRASRRASCSPTATCIAGAESVSAYLGNHAGRRHPRRAPAELRRRAQPGHDRLPRRRPRRARELPPARATSSSSARSTASPASPACRRSGSSSPTCPGRRRRPRDAALLRQHRRTHAARDARPPARALPAGAAVPHVRPHRGVPLHVSRSRPRSTAAPTRSARPSRTPRSSSCATDGIALRPGRARASSCTAARSWSLGYWNDPVRTAERFRPGARSRRRGCARRRWRCARATSVVADEDGLPLLRRPQRRDDQDVGLPRQPDRDRGGRRTTRASCATPSPSASTIRASASASCSSPARPRGEDVDAGRAARRRCASSCPLYMVPAPGRPSAASSRARRTASSTARCCASELTRHERHPTVDRVRHARRPAAVGGIAARAARRARRRRRRSSPTTAALLTERVALLRAALPADVEAQLRDQGEPDAGRRPAPRAGSSTRSTSPRRGELRIALDTPTPAERVSFAGPGKTPAELTQAVAAGVTHRARVGDRGAARHRDRRVARAAVRASRSA